MGQTRYTDATLATDPPGGKRHVVGLDPDDALPTEEGLARKAAPKPARSKTRARAKATAVSARAGKGRRKA